MNPWDKDIPLDEYAQRHQGEKPYPEVPILQEEPPLMARIGRGFQDLIDAGVQNYQNAVGDPRVAEALNKNISAENALYEQGQGGGFDGGRLVGNMAGLAPAGLAAGPTAAGGAVTGALSGLMTPVTDTEGSTPFWAKKGAQTVFGTVTGAIAPWVTRKAVDIGTIPINKLGAFAKQKWMKMGFGRAQEVLDALEEAAAKAGVSWGDLDQEMHASMVDDAIKSLSVTGALDADAVVRKQNFSRWGYEPLLGQVTRNPRQWTQEQNLARRDVGEAIRDRLMQQQEQMSANIKQAADSFGESGAASIQDEMYRVGSNVKTAAKDLAQSSQRIVSQKYDEAMNAPGIGQRVANVDMMKSRLTGIYDSFADQIPGNIRVKIDALVNSDTNNVNRLAPTAQNINSVLKLVNARYGAPANPAEGEALGQLSSVLRESLDDIANNGGQAASGLREAAKTAATRFGFIGKNRENARKIVEDLVEGKTSSDKFLMTKVINGDTDALDHLRRYLTVFPDEFGLDATKGKAAWDGIRGGVIRWMEAQAKPGATFNGGQLYKSWQSLGARRNVLFNAKEMEMLNSLTVAARDLTQAPALDYVNRSNSANAAIDFVAKASKLPMVGRLATGIFQEAEIISQLAQGASKRAAEKANQRAVLQAMMLRQPTQNGLASTVFGGGNIGPVFVPGVGYGAAPAAGMLSGRAADQLLYPRREETNQP